MDKYQQLQNIGNGQFGLVKKIMRKSDGRILVWKQVTYGSMTKQQKNQLVNEVNILKQLSHEQIVKYYEHFINKKSSKLYIVMQYCPGGDLSTLILQLQKKGQLVDQDTIWRLFFQIITALNHCHKRKIIHRDLKPANIFIDQSLTNIKIGDFGLSRELGQHSEYAKTHVGTPYFMSPEQIQIKYYNQKTDIWSLGCILYELATLKKPFRGANIFQLSEKIKKGVYQPISNKYSFHLRNIISKMLSVNQKNRPSASDILQISYIAIRTQDKEQKQKYEQIKRRQQYLRNKQSQYRKRIEELELQASLNLNFKKTKSNIESSRSGKGFKSLSILT